MLTHSITHSSNHSKTIHMTSDNRRWFEIGAVTLTAVGKFVFMNWLHVRTIFVPVIILFWIGYIWYRARQEPGILAYWGFRKDNFRKVFMMLLPVALVCVAAFTAYGLLQNTMIVSWHVLPILAMYPIWGTIQQFLVVGLVAGNLRDMEGIKVPDPLIMILTATLFGLGALPTLVPDSGDVLPRAGIYLDLFEGKKPLCARPVSRLAGSDLFLLCTKSRCLAGVVRNA
jgi:hypothetical protein